MAIEFDPFAADVLQNPYPHYARLREESPCHYAESCRAYVVTRYHDVAEVLKATAVFSSTGGVGPARESHPMMSMYDPPKHGRARKVVASLFTPAAAAALEARVAGEAAGLLGALLARGECFDAFGEFAVPLVLGSLADLMGLPRSDDADLRRWADATTDDLAAGLPPERAARAKAEIREFVGYLRGVFAARREAGDRSAVVGHLLDAVDREQFDRRELAGMCVMLVAAGFGTTAIGVGNMLAAFAEHPEQWRRVRADPGLVENAVEEAVRYDAPVQSFFRDALSDARVAGVDVPAGSKVMVVFGSANRDPRKFPDPDAFDVGRDTRQHAAFGVGIHFCIGAPFARVVLRAALRAFLARAEGLELTAPVLRRPNVLFRQLAAVPLRARAAPG